MGRSETFPYNASLEVYIFVRCGVFWHGIKGRIMCLHKMICQMNNTANLVLFDLNAIDQFLNYIHAILR
jgi:hypothetical protein